jgi:uncharacterized ion transporter superfamily protein YfcC
MFGINVAMDTTKVCNTIQDANVSVIRQNSHSVFIGFELNFYQKF